MSQITFSCIIPASAKDLKDPKLQDLIDSIKAQDFPQDQIEIIIVGPEVPDPEQAKAEGIRRATGEICAMFCADNYIFKETIFTTIHKMMKGLDITGVYSRHYAVAKNDNSLNRYFSMIGNNDPIAYYLGKSDRKPHFENLAKEVSGEFIIWPYSKMPLPSLGDNGFFVKRHILIESADLDHYYPMDVYVDINKTKMLSFFRMNFTYLWHRTSDNLFNFLKKRYRYAAQLFCDRQDRRWKIIDTREDHWKLGLFIFYTLTGFQPLSVSIRGYRKVPDYAWFWHWPVCIGFLITYTILVIRNLFKHGALFQKRPSLSRV